MKRIFFNLKDHQDKPQVIKLTLKVLKRGGLVVFPSDTVYGLLTDARNQKGVEKLISFKNRPLGKPISVFVDNFEMLEDLLEVRKEQMKVIGEILPGPFTIVLRSKHKVCELLESEKGNLGVRIPDFTLVNELVKEFGGPITATSANLSSHPPHYSIRSFLDGLSTKKKALIDLIVDVGELPRNKPSTVVDLTLPQLKILRQGDIVFKSKKIFSSRSPAQSKKIAQYILKKIITSSSYHLQKPLIFIIVGDLGVGKTVFIKGIGEYLGLKNIVSPSFVIYYEYKVLNHCINTLIHVDLYNIQEVDEFSHLYLDRYLKKGNLLCFEWGEKAGEIINLLKGKGKIVYIKMKYINEKEREVLVNF